MSDVNTFIDAVRDYVLNGKIGTRQGDMLIARAQDLLISLG